MLPVLCRSRPDLFEVGSWHKKWMFEKPTPKMILMWHINKNKTKTIAFTNCSVLPGLLFLLALLFEIKMNGCREDIVGGEKNNKQINNSHGGYYMNLRPGWRELMRALTGRVLQINGQAGAAV